MTLEKINKLKLNTEDYVPKKFNTYIYRHNIKYPISYGRDRYYIKLTDKVLKLKKSLGVSYLYSIPELTIEKEEFKRLFFQSKAYMEVIKLLHEIIPRFSSVSIPKDLINPTVHELDLKGYDPNIKLAIHWFKSDITGIVMDPSVFNLVIFDT